MNFILTILIQYKYYFKEKLFLKFIIE